MAGSPTARTPLLLNNNPIQTVAAPAALAGEPVVPRFSIRQWLKENPFAPLLFVLTLVPYTAINAAFAAETDASFIGKIFLAIFTILASDSVNLAFDILTAKEIQEDVVTHVRAIRDSEEERTIVQNWGPVVGLILFYVISFHTAIAWKIAGERALESFRPTLGDGTTDVAQIDNDVYMFFTALMFAMAIFKLPALIKDIFIQKDPLIKFLLGGFLLAGGFLGVTAYLALGQELLSFPQQIAQQQQKPDFLGKYLISALEAWSGFAYIFPITQGAFCVLNSTRGLIEFMKHGIGLCEGKPEERPFRANILFWCLAAAVLSIFTSAYQANGLLRDGISACSIFVNISALAKLIRTHYEHQGRLEHFESIVARAKDKPAHRGAQQILDRLTPAKRRIALEDASASTGTGSIQGAFAPRFDEKRSQDGMTTPSNF